MSQPNDYEPQRRRPTPPPGYADTGHEQARPARPAAPDGQGAPPPGATRRLPADERAPVRPPVVGRPRPTTGERPIAGRGERRARPTTGAPEDRPSYHPRATGNNPMTGARAAASRARAGLTGTMAIGGRLRGGERGSRGVSDRGRPPARPGERDALYDTVDQQVLGKIEVRERDGDATVYGRTGERAAAAALTRVGTGPGQRRGTDPGGPGGPTGPRRPGGPGGPGGPARPMGTRGPKFWRKLPLWARRTILFGTGGFILMMVAGMGILYAATKVPLPDQINTDEQATVIYYADGQNVLAKTGELNRIPVSLSEISKPMQKAVLAAEDKRFYEEPGISPRGILRALYVDLKGGEVAQGGSTITQQYVKNAYLTQDRSFSRKIKEIVMAVKLSKSYSKDKILEFYLNTIYYGRNAYGIEAASEAYFGIHAKDLNAAQAAVIAGLIRNPTYLDPSKYPADNQKRWKQVIDTMVEEKWIDSAPEYPKDSIKPYKVDDGTGSNPQAHYILDRVKTELEAKAGITEDQIKTQGLRITTTIDFDRQVAAVNAVNSVIGPVFPSKINNLKTGLLAVDPSTGAILAWYGGSQYGEGAGETTWVDTVSGAAIPSGSTFKTVTLLAALKNGVSVNSTFESPDEVTLDGDYTVHNDEGDVTEPYTSLVDATAMSLNTVYVPLGFNSPVGVSSVIAMAKSLGVTSHLEQLAGVTLGQDSVHATEMTSVYSTLASGGVRTDQHIVANVLNAAGHSIYRAPSNATKVLDDNVVRDATYALQSVLTKGTATSSKLADGRPAAGKTGTVQDFRSAWFCGFTAGPNNIAACVDMFRGEAEMDNSDPDNPKPAAGQALRGDPGLPAGGVYGGTWPAKIWKTFMDAAMKGKPVQQFQPAANGGTVIDQATASPTPTATDSGLFPSGNPLFPSATSTNGDGMGNGNNDPWGIFGKKNTATADSGDGDGSGDTDGDVTSTPAAEETTKKPWPF